MGKGGLAASITLSLTLVGVGSAQELPATVRAKLAKARVAVEQHKDSRALVGAIAHVGSAGLSLGHQAWVGQDFLNLCALLEDGGDHVGVLDVSRAFQRAFPSIHLVVEAGLCEARALRALKDPRGAQQVYLRLLDAAPPRTAAWVRQERLVRQDDVLEAFATLAEDQGRPAAALQARLDAVLVRLLRGRRRYTIHLETAPEARLFGALTGGTEPSASTAAAIDDVVAQPAVIAITERSTGGALVELRLADVLKEAARVLQERGHPAQADAARALATNLPRVVRPYALPLVAGERLARLRVRQATIEDQRRRLPRLRKRAATGDAAGQCALAQLIGEGVVVARSSSRKLELLREATRAGSEEAVSRLIQHSPETAVAALTSRTRAIVTKIAQSGRSDALLVLALAEPDHDLAMRGLLRAAREGSRTACTRLAERSVRAADVLFWERCAVWDPEQEIMERAEALGVAWLKRLPRAARRYPSAAEELLRHRGWRVEPSPETARWRRAAKARRGPPGKQLTDLFGHDRAAAVNERAWATRAARAGDAWAEAYAGWFAARGLGGLEDLDAARAHFRRAAAAGSPLGHLGLARLDEALEGPRADPARVDAGLRRAGRGGIPAAWVRLAHRLEARGAKGATTAWARALEAKAPQAQLRAARERLRATPPQRALAAPLLRSAAAAGSHPAYVRLLILLREHPTLRVASDP